MALERVQKILAKAGIASRRKAEEMITLGEVTINGQVAKLGDKADFGKDAIKVKGKLLRGQEAKTYYAFYKPKNVISSLSDPEGRPSIGDYLKRIDARIYPVGRLDFTSEGLILLTNDGDLAEKLQRQDNLPRVYYVKIKGHPNAEMLSRLERGLKVGQRYVKPHSIRLSQEFTNKSQVEVVLLGAGAVDLKEFFETRGFLVERITRVGIGHLTLQGMRPGEFQMLKPSSMEALLAQPELGLKRLERIQDKEPDLIQRRTERDEREAEKAERAERRQLRGRVPKITPLDEMTPRQKVRATERWSGGGIGERAPQRRGAPRPRRNDDERSDQAPQRRGAPRPRRNDDAPRGFAPSPRGSRFGGKSDRPKRPSPSGRVMRKSSPRGPSSR